MPRFLPRLSEVCRRASLSLYERQLAMGTEGLTTRITGNQFLNFHDVVVPTNQHQLILIDLDDTLIETETHYKQLQQDIVAELHVLTGLDLDELNRLYVSRENQAVEALGFSGARQLVFLTGLFHTVLQSSRADNYTASDSTLLRDEQLFANKSKAHGLLARVRFLQEFVAIPAIERNLFGSYQLREGAAELLEQLARSHHRVVIVTKGDGYLQGLKISALFQLFPRLVGRIGHAILHQKTKEAYDFLIRSLGASPASTIMIGDSIASDVRPPLELGCMVYHLQGGTTWALEQLTPAEVLEFLLGRTSRLHSVKDLHEVANALRLAHPESNLPSDT